jgi:hypothetical protein
VKSWFERFISVGGWLELEHVYQIQALALALASQLETHTMAQRREAECLQLPYIDKDSDDADTQCSNNITR